VINRMGFNNGGIAAALPRAKAAKRAGMLGINVGANKDATDRVADYETGVAAAAPVADYVTINISSPNTPGLRDLQRGPALADLLARCAAARGTTPLFLKVAPDQEPAQIDEIARAAIDAGIDALIVGNTTVSRPALQSPNAIEQGGLSGAPLAVLAAQRLRDFRVATGAQLTLIAVGGIDSGAEAYARIRAGASLVQLYTGLVYGGPRLPVRILRDLAALLGRDGFASIEDAIGAG
jgi:dihydroorotate dehydrogenase